MALARLLLAAAAAAATAASMAPGSPPPNIIFILADDLEADYKQDRLALMPNLRRLRTAGVSFENHIASIPLCGPSRGALLSGRLAHNNGYRHNLDAASLAAWRVIENNTIGSWLTHAGYRTAYLGKYLNGLETTVPAGWNWYGGFDGIVGTYNYYSAQQFNVSFDDAGLQPTSPITSVSRNGTHQADFLGAQAVELMQDAVARGKPFFVHLAPVMIHYGTCSGPFIDVFKYAATDPFWEMSLEFFGCPNSTLNQHCSLEASPCVSQRNAHAADGLTNPHTPAWDTIPSGGVPPSMQLPPATAYEQERQDIAFRNRTGSALDLDDMLGVVLDGLAALGPAVAANTFVVFTSDNGYHLNEHRLILGKEHPYTTDVRVPLYISGPGIPPNSTAQHPTTHVDLTATLVELAGATPVGPPLDGLSFTAALTPSPIAPEAWRNFSYAENADDGTTWVQLRRPLASADPGDEAAATAFHWWCANASELFDLAADPWQLVNLANSTPRGQAVAREALPFLLALAGCAGANCSAPTPLAVVPANPLRCYTTNRTI